MSTTTTAKAPNARRRVDGRLWAVAVSAIMGATLAALAFPRTIAAWTTIGGDRIFESLWNVKPPSDQELASGASYFEHAIEWSPSSARYVHLATIELEQAQRLPNQSKERTRLRQSADRHIVQGLSVNPVDGFGWLTLALARQRSGMDKREIAAAGIQSLDMQPNMQWIWLSRAQLLLLYSEQLQPDELLSFQRQLRTIWSFPKFRKPLIMAGLTSFSERSLMVALQEDPEALPEYQRLKTAMMTEGPAKP